MQENNYAFTYLWLFYFGYVGSDGLVQGSCIHMSCRYIWRRIRRTRKRKAGGWREAGVAVDRGVNVYRQRLSAEGIWGRRIREAAYAAGGR